MKTVSATLTAKLAAVKTEPIWMMDLILGTPVYFTTGPALSFGGNSYTHQDFTVPNPIIGNNADAVGKVVFQGVDNVFTSLVQQAGFVGTRAILYTTVQLATYAADDVVLFLDSEVDSYEIDPGKVTVDLKLQPIIFPFELVNADAGFTNVDPPGTYVFSAGTVVLRDARLS